MKYYLLLVVLLVAVIACSSPKQQAPKAEIKREMDTTYVAEESSVKIEYFRIKSPSMERDIKVVVVLPPEYDAHPEKKYPVLYTLHGYGAPWDTWSKMVKLRNQLKDKPFIYTCFDGDIGGFYIDSRFPLIKGGNIKGAEKSDSTTYKSLFTTFFFDEFVPGIDQWYRVDASKRAVTGFSMGGCGAMTYMLQKPDMFCSVSGLSSTYYDFSDTTGKGTKWMLKFIGPYNEENKPYYDALDHYKLIEKYLAAGVKLPPIYQHIGTEDFLIEQNHRFKKFAEEKGLDFTYEESKGAHNWKFWHPASVGIAEFHWKYFSQAQ